MYELFEGDCFDTLRRVGDESIDLILTDPPYGMHFQSGRRGEKYEYIKNDNSLGWVGPWVEEMWRVIKPNSAMYSFCSFHHIEVFKSVISKRFKVKNVLVWEKGRGMGDLKGDFAPSVEFVILAVKGRPLIRGRRDPNIFKFTKTKNENHPTEKPVDLLGYLISKFSDPGARVLDCFMGSGSTGVAALRAHRRFVGMEMNSGYFSIARSRVEAAASGSMDLGGLL